jgi:hypothetical protein
MLLSKPVHANFTGMLIIKCHYDTHMNLFLPLWLIKSIGILFEIYGK